MEVRNNAKDTNQEFASKSKLQLFGHFEVILF